MIRIIKSEEPRLWIDSPKALHDSNHGMEIPPSLNSYSVCQGHEGQGRCHCGWLATERRSGYLNVM